MHTPTRRDRGTGAPRTASVFALIILTFAIAACGSGTGTPGRGPQPPLAAQCIPADPATASECGTVVIGLTDADGDFLSYTVDVMSLQLERRDGATVEVLPASTRIDFAQYVDLTEFLSVATVPPGDYIAGTIRLDYSNAEILVEASGEAKQAVVVDATGAEVGESELKIMLADRHHLVVKRGLASLLTLDFDLAASHLVDVVPSPAVAVAELFIVAEIEPVDSNDFRVRGRLTEVDIAGMSYRIALLPFHGATGDFGRATINVGEFTDFEVNDERFVGADGLAALDAAGAGTLTVARGTLDVAARSFTADFVLAGSSVPGNGKDAVKGNVISRTGDEFVVRGGTVLLSDTRPAFFRDDVTVAIGPDTVVYKSVRADRPLGMPVRLLDRSAISIGQAVTVRGTVIADDEFGTYIDASQGAVIMHLTHLSGIVNTSMPGQVDIDLHAIDRRRADVFDFTGSGASPASDADAGNYEVATGPLTMSAGATGQPVAVYGFPTPFAMAPPDFEGRTIIDYAEVRGALGIGWGASGTTAPFLMMDAAGLLLDNDNTQIDQRHHIKQGPVVIDLQALGSDTLIAPRLTGRAVFSLRTTDSLQLYADFDDYVAALALELDGVNAARSMYARGQYDSDTNVFTAYKIFIHLLEP